jgi:hypothetical protein
MAIPYKAFDIARARFPDQEMSVRDRAATYINRSVVRLRVHDWSGALAIVDLAITRVSRRSGGLCESRCGVSNLWPHARGD